MSEPPVTPTHRIALVDGDTVTPLSAEALVLALFQAGLLLLRNPAGQLVGVSVDRPKVLALATALQAELDTGGVIGLQQDRVLRPGGNGLVAP